MSVMLFVSGFLLGVVSAGVAAAAWAAALEERLTSSRRETQEALALFRRTEAERRRLARRLGGDI